MPYHPTQLPDYISVCQRQRAKDKLFLERIIPWLQPGEVLEIGAGCAQLSEILADHGIDATASDIEPFFLDYHEQLGLKTLRVDARDILSGTGRLFNNILTQGVSTLVTRNLEDVSATYHSIWNALNTNGRLIFIFPNAYQRPGKPWSTIDDHWPIINEVGFHVVKHCRHQLFPSQWYHYLSGHLTQALEKTIGTRFGMRNVFVLEKSTATSRAVA